MASRGVASVPIFYVSESGVVYQPASDNDAAAERVDHDVEESRVRLANILRSRKQQQQQQQQQNDKLRQHEEEAKLVELDQNEEELKMMNANNNEEDEWEDVESSDEGKDEDNANAMNNTYGADLAIRRIQVQQQRTIAGSLVDREKQLQMNRLLARGARLSNVKNGSSTKAIASQFVHKVKPADNAAARAVVHHTGSHYHMAGGVQFQRGLRVKGVVSRHSKQGAKLQAARTAQRNMYEAREDARGERAEGGGRSQGKAKKSKKKKRDQDA